MTLPFLILAIGGAADYAHVLKKKAELQAAVDSAILHAASYAVTHQDDASGIRSRFQNHLREDVRKTNLLTLRDVRVQYLRRNGKLRATVKADVPTSFLKFAGINPMGLTVQAEAMAAMGKTEVVLVLDTTGSMRGAKIAELKRAAKRFLDTIHDKIRNQPAGSFKVGIVPFAQYVNVGTQYRNAPWISVPPDKTLRKSGTSRICRECTRRETTREWRCRTTGGGDGTPGTRTCGWRNVTRCVQWRNLSPCRTETWNAERHIRWKGCVGSRSGGLNVRDENYAVRVPAVMNKHLREGYTHASTDFDAYTWEHVACPKPLTPLKDLKTARSTLKARIDQLRANGKTYIPAGLVWGWRVLSHREPFSQGADDAEVNARNVRKIIVLMTDGKNTRAPDRYAHYFQHTSGDTDYANQLTVAACNNIKATNPATGRPHADIITITFEVRDPTIKRLLQQCSTLGSHDVASGQLERTFENIAQQLVQVHLSR